MKEGIPLYTDRDNPRCFPVSIRFAPNEQRELAVDCIESWGLEVHVESGCLDIAVFRGKALLFRVDLFRFCVWKSPTALQDFDKIIIRAGTDGAIGKMQFHGNAVLAADDCETTFTSISVLPAAGVETKVRLSLSVPMPVPPPPMV